MRRAIGITLAAMVCAALAGCSPPSNESGQVDEGDNGAANTAQARSALRPDELAIQERPADQVTLEGLLKGVNDAELPSGNAINDKANFMKAYQVYCTKMQNNGVLKNWTAVVHGIYPGDPNSEVSKKPSIYLATPGGLEVFQELNEDSPLYKVVLGLKEGDYVRFSINITHVEEGDPRVIDNECQDPDYDGPRGPQVNAMLGGGLTSLAPIS